MPPPALALGTAALLVATPAGADTGTAKNAGTRDSYGTKATYTPGQNPRSYQRPPAGFTPVFTENVSRHGSRSGSDGEDADLVLAAGCLPIAEGSTFYKLDELERCFGRTNGAS